MSIAALDWAFKQPIEQSSMKFVLVALANYAGPNGECIFYGTDTCTCDPDLWGGA